MSGFGPEGRGVWCQDSSPGTVARLAISGAIPASIFAGAPRLAPAASLVPITIGLIIPPARR